MHRFIPRLRPSWASLVDKAKDQSLRPLAVTDGVTPMTAVPRWVAIDFDTVLARFVSPERNRLVSRVRRLLQAITESGHDELVVFSTHPLDRLRAPLRGVRAHRIGERGWETSRFEGHKVVHQLPARAARRLSQAVQAAEACGWRNHLERRRCSVRLITEGMSPFRAQLLRDAAIRLLSPDFETDGLRMMYDEGGVELQAIERSPATALQEVVGGGRPAPPVIVIRLAQDSHPATDRQRPRDWIRPFPEFDISDVELPSAAEVVHWLHRWTLEARR